MFSKNTSEISRSNDKASSAVNAIGQGSTIKGDIITEGDLRIDGTLTGSITTKGRLVIGETGLVEGEVVCQNALIAGTLKAKIQVHELLSLKATANLSGDIITNKLAIEPGANFTGSCSMGASIKNIKSSDSNGKHEEKTA
ncbi:MAG: polymer-forming cytoskeletal protein [Flavobacteriales bacterium]|jgi:cytoskeletal protein CcmA (bactofilin family)|tara:strand:- start:4567 stop:4989 length:423 start_codon:yes stop_codon:yes gene_type:complete